MNAALDVDPLAVDEVPLFRGARRRPADRRAGCARRRPAGSLAEQLAENGVHSLLVSPMMARNEVVGMGPLRSGGTSAPIPSQTPTVSWASRRPIRWPPWSRTSSCTVRKHAPGDRRGAAAPGTGPARFGDAEHLLREPHRGGVAAVRKREPDEGLTNLVRLRRLVRAALAEMRTLLFELRPATLEAASLETLIERLAETRSPVRSRSRSMSQSPRTCPCPATSRSPSIEWCRRPSATSPSTPTKPGIGDTCRRRRRGRAHRDRRWARVRPRCRRARPHGSAHHAGTNGQDRRLPAGRELTGPGYESPGRVGPPRPRTRTCGAGLR